MTKGTSYQFKSDDHILNQNGFPLPGYALDGNGIFDRIVCIQPPGV